MIVGALLGSEPSARSPGIRGEIKIKLRLEFFRDANAFAHSSAEVLFFSSTCSRLLPGFAISVEPCVG